MNSLLCVVTRPLNATSRDDARLGTPQDFFLGLVIWGVLDPSNIFVSSTTGPVVIAMGKYCPEHEAEDCPGG